MSAEWVEHRAAGGLSVMYPPDWTPFEGMFGTEFAVARPRDDGGYACSLSVVRGPRAPGAETAAVVQAQAQLLLDQLDDALLIDVELKARLGSAGSRRLLLSHTDRGRDLTLEQWQLDLAADRVMVITASMPTLEYADLAETMSAIAESVRWA